MLHLVVAKLNLVSQEQDEWKLLYVEGRYELYYARMPW